MSSISFPVTLVYYLAGQNTGKATGVGCVMLESSHAQLKNCSRHSCTGGREILNRSAMS